MLEVNLCAERRRDYEPARHARDCGKIGGLRQLEASVAGRRSYRIVGAGASARTESEASREDRSIVRRILGDPRGAENLMILSLLSS